MTNNNVVPNRLINEKSPYLLQHAYNPVDWFPWSQEAFDKAKLEDKPIFLSIGYSTCHRCHVMERESFEDIEVADYLNKHFVSIKVDREERPDVDTIYMNVCQALTGSGGWPLTIIMTHDQKPFFAGTYYPKNDKMGMQGLMTILKAISNEWTNNRKHILESGDKITEYISRNRKASMESISEDIFDEAFFNFEQYFDATYGGFGHTPKFPTPHNLMFLLRYWKRANNPKALQMVEKTLDSMYRGGIYDHIGFGFCRYSTDNKWLVPHFEKMLYDNALLAIAYLEVYQATKKEEYGSIARDILTYILRDMTSPEGAFYCAEDADSEGVEGKFYLWELEEINSILGEEEGRAYASFYNITSKGNFEGKSIPNLINNKLDYKNINNLKVARDMLFKYREKRIHPLKDDKILTSLNGLMIVAMAIAGRVLEENIFTQAAINAIDFIFNNLIRNDGRLLAVYRDEATGHPAYLDDYAFLTLGLIELYETTYKAVYLKRALSLSDELLELFWDKDNGGLFLYGNDGEQLITRPKEVYDGAIPSGNSVSALNFIKLSRLTGKYELEERAHQILKTFSDSITAQPISHSYSLMALLFCFSKGQEIIISTDTLENARPYTEIIKEKFRPFSVSMVYSKDDEILNEISPFLNSYKITPGKTAVYVCEKHSCKAPVTDYKVFKEMLL
ncbi:MAG: thioredoxin domain-containing protein [Clostridiaceae bacterium]|nr:thioredoxin domain-containing protein [Clostridiaceae bacterium]